MIIIKADKDMTLTAIENEYVEAVMSGDDDVAIEITGAQADKMDLDSDDE